MDEFCMCLSNKPNLKILGLEFNHLAEIGPKLISVLNQLPALEKAFFSHNSLQVDTATALAGIMPKFINLKDI